MSEDTALPLLCMLCLLLAQTSHNRASSWHDSSSQQHSAVFDKQANSVTPEVRGHDGSSGHESLYDSEIGRNADLYIFNQEVDQN